MAAKSEEPHGDSERTSSRLTIGQAYSRQDLRELFNITAASLNNGTFHVKPYRSVWLFITEHKTPDRTQYRDALVGDELRMEGQTEGKTDRLIKEHVALGLELLLFYRKSKDERLHGAFVYEGPFRYVSHDGARPTKFVLLRERGTVSVRKTGADKGFELDNIGDARTPAELGMEAADSESAFAPPDDVDSRTRAYAAIVLRRGQAAFRKSLIEAYEGKCAVTGCDFVEALEAAHITPYRGEHTDVVTNGLLLRADIHTLFDLGHIAIDPETMSVLVSPALGGSMYRELTGRKLSVPRVPAQRPNREALQRHRQYAGL